MCVDLTDYDFILINSSAGKDSQAMLDYIVEVADKQGVYRENLVVVHSDLGRVEWPGSRDLAEQQDGPGQEVEVRSLAGRAMGEGQGRVVRQGHVVQRERAHEGLEAGRGGGLLGDRPQSSSSDSSSSSSPTSLSVGMSSPSIEGITSSSNMYVNFCLSSK